jgi:hypothetical protein
VPSTGVGERRHDGRVTYTCDYCDRVATGETLPLAWATSVENGKSLVYCDRCAREHVRGIEGRLDNEWW